MFITLPGIAITMTPESLLRSFRNAHHDRFGIAITVPRNPQHTKSSAMPQNNAINLDFGLPPCIE
jgi:hypothetical protein